MIIAHYPVTILELGTIHFWKPLPLPLLLRMRVAPAACAASLELYVVISGVGVCCTGLLVGVVWVQAHELGEVEDDLSFELVGVGPVVGLVERVSEAGVWPGWWEGSARH